MNRAHRRGSEAFSVAATVLQRRMVMMVSMESVTELIFLSVEANLNALLC